MVIQRTMPTALRQRREPNRLPDAAAEGGLRGRELSGTVPPTARHQRPSEAATYGTRQSGRAAHRKGGAEGRDGGNGGKARVGWGGLSRQLPSCGTHYLKLYKQIL